MLAEKVETRKEFEAARKEGFIYFQRYFFRRLELMTTHAIPANRLNYIRMLQAVSKPELDQRELENVIKSEASICYRVLRISTRLRLDSTRRFTLSNMPCHSSVNVKCDGWVRLIAPFAAGQDKTPRVGAVCTGPGAVL